MTLKRFIRKLHWWLSLVTLLPLGVVLISGLMLQVKKEWHWVQPPTQTGSQLAPDYSPAMILAQCQTVPQAGIKGWEDISRIDIQPDRGIIKVSSRSHWEIQLDHHNCEVLQAARRRSDQIESFHDGSFISGTAKTWLFLPMGILVLVLWISGLILLLNKLFPYKLKQEKHP